MTPITLGLLGMFVFRKQEAAKIFYDLTTSNTSVQCIIRYNITDSPVSKKIKTTMEPAPDTEWPEAWLMPTGDCMDQKAPNKLEPNVSVSAEELKEIGIK